MDERSPETPGAPLARLLWQMPEGEEQESPLGDATVTIGRGTDCDVVVSDTRISRCHAEIRCDGGTFIVADLGSANGTFVNDERVEEPRELQDGDRVRVGPVEFRFELLAVPEPPTEVELPQRPTILVPEPSTMPHLEVSSGPQRGVRFELVKDKIVVGRAGRGQQWDIVLQDRAVSRPHAQITREADDFVLTDLDSANGTLVNGGAISEPHTLSDGDAIALGETILIFHAGAG
jgi:pSer/pThr/pTyr-binding forkhead associated (FHA) protein